VRVKKTIAIVPLVVAAALFAWIYFTREPSADGRTLTEWLRVGTETMADDYTEVTNAVRKIGAAAVPTLLTKLRAENPAWKLKLDNEWGRKILPYHWLDSAGHQNAEAEYGFSILGTQAILALPELSRMCLDTNRFSSPLYGSGVCLGYIGPKALPFLKAALTNQNSEVRRRAASGIVATREMARQSWPEILALRNESDWRVAQTILAGTAGRLSEAEMLNISTNFLQNHSILLQTFAVVYVGRFCTNSTAAVPFIVPFLVNSNAILREQATNALLKIDRKLAAAQGVSRPLRH